MRLRVIVNRGGGTLEADGGETAQAEIRDAFASAGVDADVRMTDPGRIGNAFDEAATAAGLDAVVAAGGDGTVSCAAARLAGGERPLGILPLGTLNHFARDAGIPAGLPEAAAAIAAGHVREVDLGEVNGHVFVNNSAIGLYPRMVRTREEQQRFGRSRRLAMLLASLNALRRFSRHRLTISISGLEAPIETPLLFVGNNRYETSLLTLGRRRALDRGELCLYAPLVRSRLRFLGLGLRGVLGFTRQRDFIALDGVTEAEVHSRRPSLAVSADGETLRIETPLRYRIRPGVLKLIVPAPPPAER